MDVTFLLHLRLDDVSTITDVAADIQDDLTSSGHDVISVEPWQRPTLAQQTAPLFQLPSPPTDSIP